jgi:hypothetical protein
VAAGSRANGVDQHGRDWDLEPLDSPDKPLRFCHRQRRRPGHDDKRRPRRIHQQRPEPAESLRHLQKKRTKVTYRRHCLILQEDAHQRLHPVMYEGRHFQEPKRVATGSSIDNEEGLPTGCIESVADFNDGHQLVKSGRCELHEIPKGSTIAPYTDGAVAAESREKAVDGITVACLDRLESSRRVEFASPQVRWRSVHRTRVISQRHTQGVSERMGGIC